MLKNICGHFFPEEYAVTQRPDDGAEYIFELVSISRSAKCPCCGTASNRKHDYQSRKIRDLPILGKPVTLLMNQMKYYCDEESCDVEIFTEQRSLVSPYSQFTVRCREYMLKVAAQVSCEAAVRILAYQGIRVCGDTLLNMIKAAGSKYDVKAGKKIGVDDWAYRKGQKYGTLICDLETHAIIDVLEGRDSETLEKWLKGRSDIEIVSRDRASAYSSAVGKVLPEAVQIADRFHITKNLLEALNDTMKAFMPEAVEVPKDESEEPASMEVKELVKKTRKCSNGRRRK